MGRVSETAAPMRAAAASLRAPLAAVARIAESRGPSPFAGRPLYHAPRGPAHAQARLWRVDRPADAELMDRLAAEPTALWLGDWTGDVGAVAARRVAAARAKGAIPVLVAYNIPNRDYGLHSAGGAGRPEDYRAWIADLADGLGGGPAAVVLEPDALAALGGLPASARGDRTSLLAWATARLSRRPGVSVYIDAGNASWVAPAEMARRLREAGVARARGFAVNVSELPHHRALARVRQGDLAPGRRRAVRHRHQPQRGGPRARATTGATRRAARSARRRRVRPGTPRSTPSSGSSAPASRTAAATAPRPPEPGGPRARWPSPERREGSRHETPS